MTWRGKRSGKGWSMLQDSCLVELYKHLDGYHSQHGMLVKCQPVHVCLVGSRMSGMSEQHSDVDLRFLYVWPEAAYHVPTTAAPDALEWTDTISVHGVKTALDVAGWDMDKAMRLLMKSNQSILEWLFSPIDLTTGLAVYDYRYSTVDAPGPVRQRLLELLRGLAVQHLQAASLWYSYRGMARDHFKRYIEGQPSADPKKYLFVVRAALWMLLLNDVSQSWSQQFMQAVMSFRELTQAVSVQPDVRDAITFLLGCRAAHEPVRRGHHTAVSLDDWLFCVLEKDAPDVQNAPPISAVDLWDVERELSLLRERTWE